MLATDLSELMNAGWLLTSAMYAMTLSGGLLITTDLSTRDMGSSLLVGAAAPGGGAEGAAQRTKLRRAVGRARASVRRVDPRAAVVPVAADRGPREVKPAALVVDPGDGLPDRAREGLRPA